jgi:hypothetical protein
LLFYKYSAPTALFIRVSPVLNLWQNLFPKTIMGMGQKEPIDSKVRVGHYHPTWPKIKTYQ